VPCYVESPVLAAARELFDARQFPGVAAVCAEALAERPRDVSLRLLRARALLALRRDAAAQAEVSEILRLEPGCGGAYRLLGELAARRDELASAHVFLCEAQRLAPGDDEITVWLAIVAAMIRPTPAAEPSAAAPRVPSPLAPLPPRAPHVRLVPRGGTPAPVAPLVVAAAAPVTPPAASPVVAPPPAAVAPPTVPARRPGPPPLPPAVAARSRAAAPRATPPPLPKVRAPIPPTFAAPVAPARVPVRRFATARGTEPPPVGPAAEPPAGFGAYLVDVGVLSALQLRATLAYKKSTGVRLGAAAVALGFATDSRIESASLVYHGRHRRPSTIDVVATARPERRDDGFGRFHI